MHHMWRAVLVVALCVALGGAHALGDAPPTPETTTLPEGHQWRPVVLMHGITSTAADMDLPAQWIEKALPGVYVKNVAITLHGMNGYDTSVLTPVTEQIQSFCDQIAADEKLQHGFNLIGYSQGGVVTRGYVEMCNDKHLVYNYITWSGPHGGQFGVPMITNTLAERALSDLVAKWPYISLLQKHISFSQYWRDPYNLHDYHDDCLFLPLLDNEKPHKDAARYKANMMSVNHFAMLMSKVDEVIAPRESGWFGTWRKTSSAVEVSSLDGLEVVPMRERPIYTEDRIGLKALDTAGKLSQFATMCPHTDYPKKPCYNYFTEFTLPLLQNTMPVPAEK